MAIRAKGGPAEATRDIKRPLSLLHKSVGHWLLIVSSRQAWMPIVLL